MTERERRTTAAELRSAMERLRHCTARTGAVDRQIFALEADRLGLRTDEQRGRFRTVLADVGIHVEPEGEERANHHIAPDPNEETGQVARARRMLSRYADTDGTVSRLAHDGVLRLHGLGPAEARELIADFPITRPAAPRVPDEPAAARVEAHPENGRVDAQAVDRSMADAVRAARAVLEDDRWRRRPDKILLKAEEEVGLAVLLRGGTDRLDRDIPREEIAALPRGGERWRAHESFVMHNRALVWKIAYDYQGRGLDLEDLVQHGTFGLLRTVRRFDATRGCKFSTYATTWIKQTLGRAVADEGTLIRIPVHMHEKVHKVAAAERKLAGEGSARTVDNIVFATGLTFTEVEKVRKISRPTDSLDRIIGDDTALGDLIIGPSRLPGPASVLLRKDFQARLRHVLERHCTERERHILVRRMGLDGAEPDTLDVIGAVFGVSRERIRQVEKKAKASFHDELVRHRLVPSAPAGHDTATAPPSDTFS